MTLMDVIRARHSVRKYLDKPVERDRLMLCLEAARLSPSACNSQPWRFVVVDEPALRQKLADAAFGGIYRMEFAKKAPLLIAVVADQKSLVARAGGTMQGTEYCLTDLGIAGEHLVLQASELGLGTCWIGWFNARAARRVLGIPRGKKIAYLLSLGYPAADPSARAHQRKSLEEIASFNGWK